MKGVIYYHSEKNIKEIANEIANLLDIKLRSDLNSLVFAVDFHMKVRRNPDGLEFGRFNFDFPHGCLEFNSTIEITWSDNIHSNIIIEIVVKILPFLWEQDIPAVASGFEREKLPYKGGYNCKHLPWPKSDFRNLL